MTRMRRALRTAAFMLLLLTVVPGAAMPEEQGGAAAEGPVPASTEQGRPGTLAMPEGAAQEPFAAPQETARTKDGDTYIIREGDTLWDISSAFLQDPFLWPLIWKFNPYIANPDLIYPGNKLLIPSMAPIARAMQMPVEKAPAKEPEEVPVKGRAIEKPFMGRRLQPEPEVVEEEKPVESHLLLPEEITPPLMDKYAMLSAGFVERDEESPDVVVGGLEPKSIFGFDDMIFVKTSPKEDVQIGDKYLVYEPFKRVRHPETGRNFGRLTKILGILLVTGVEPSGIVTGKVTLSFDAIEKGNMVTPYEEPVLVYPDQTARSKAISGYILEVRDTRTINGQWDVVYLDKGSLDGVEPGDTFTVYLEPNKRGYPNKVIGEVQVFLVKERTATAVVRKSIDAMARGDRIIFKQ